MIGTLILMSAWPDRFNFNAFPNVDEWYTAYAPYECIPGGYKFLRAVRDLGTRLDAVKRAAANNPASSSTSVPTVPAVGATEESSSSEGEDESRADVQAAVGGKPVSTSVPGDIVINATKVRRLTFLFISF